MDKNKLWLIGSVLVTSVIVVLGVLLGVQPQLDSMNTADASRAAVQRTNAGHVALLTRLKHDFEGLEALTKTAEALAESVPSGSAMPAFVDQLDAQAQAVGLTLTGMTVTEAQAYVPIVPAASAAAAAVPSSAAAAAPRSEAATASEATTPAALITAGNFAAFPLQITVTGTYAQVLEFVASLQSGGRLFLVHGIDTVQASGEDALVDATISGLVYSLVAPAAASVG
jgi:Tfp pilus assembly protein PilO